MFVAAPPRPPAPGDPVDREDLEALIEEARRRARRRRRIYGVVAASSALVAVAVFAVIERAASSESAPPPSGTRVSLSAAATSSKIAFLRDPDGDGMFGDGNELWVMNPDGSGQLRLAPKASEHVWSPDARRIAFVRSRLGAPLPRGGRAIHHDVYVVNADGSGERRLTSGPRGGDGFPAWSPDGRRLAFTRGSLGLRTTDIFVMNADGSGQRRLTSGLRVTWSPVWSPDGRAIAFTSGRGGASDIYVINADGKGQRQLTSVPTVVFFPAWSPDGRKIAFTGTTDNVPAVQEPLWEVYLINADGSDQQKLGRGLLPVWSPDGRKIAFLQGGVRVMNADGTGRRRLGASLSDVAPSWSPDARQLIFSRFVGSISAAVREHGGDAEGNFEVFVANVDGSGSRNLTRNPGDDVAGAWSASGGP